MVEITKFGAFFINDSAAGSDDVKKIARHLTSPNRVRRRVRAASAILPRTSSGLQAHQKPARSELLVIHLYLGEQLMPVHFRHDVIARDDIRPLSDNHFKSLPSIGGLGRNESRFADLFG